jgi:acetyl esterase/lipase
MSKSITYYLTIWIIKLKGIKKIFSESPINFLALRKEDVHLPKSSFYKTNKTSTFSILKTKVTQIINASESDKLLIYIHGGAFISGPVQHHWDSLKKISKNTNYNIWFCNYPKAPENKLEEITVNVDRIYQKALQEYKSENIVLMGDSVGGSLIIALTQRLLSKNINLPSKIILISPILDASYTNPEIDLIDKKDPMLSKIGIISSNKMCTDDLYDKRISPIYGDFKNFPRTYLYAAENDISFPDQLLMASKLKEENVENFIQIGKGMPHIWPLLPVMKEARISLNEIIKELNR